MYLRPAVLSVVHGGGQRMAADRTLASFTSIGRLTPAITSTQRAAPSCEMAQVAGRAAEHVGQQHDPVAAVDLQHALLHLASSPLDVVVGADAHGRDLTLRADDVFHGQPQLICEATMGDQHKSDHAWAQASCA